MIVRCPISTYIKQHSEPCEKCKYGTWKWHIHVFRVVWFKQDLRFNQDFCSSIEKLLYFLRLKVFCGNLGYWPFLASNYKTLVGVNHEKLVKKYVLIWRYLSQPDLSDSVTRSFNKIQVEFQNNLGIRSGFSLEHTHDANV